MLMHSTRMEGSSHQSEKKEYGRGSSGAPGERCEEIGTEGREMEQIYW